MMCRETYPVQQKSKNDQWKVVATQKTLVQNLIEKYRKPAIFICSSPWRQAKQKTKVGHVELNRVFPTNQLIMPLKKRKRNIYRLPSITQTQWSLKRPPALSLCPHHRPPISCGRPVSTSRDTCLGHSRRDLGWGFGSQVNLWGCFHHPNSMMDLQRYGHLSIYLLKNPWWMFFLRKKSNKRLMERSVFAFLAPCWGWGKSERQGDVFICFMAALHWKKRPAAHLLDVQIWCQWMIVVAFWVWKNSVLHPKELNYVPVELCPFPTLLNGDPSWPPQRKTSMSM